MDALPHRGKHRFIEYPEHATHLADRLYSDWIITVSILLTKFLHLGEKPMYRVGICIEFVLNLLSDNGGLLGIIFRVLTGSNILSDSLFIISTNKKILFMLS